MTPALSLNPRQAPALPPQPFFARPEQRTGLARERFFEQGLRPTGLVGEAVIQSWARCVGAQRRPGEAVAFDPVTRARLRATLARNQTLLSAASADIASLEAALSGTAVRVILTDGDGVVVHASALPGNADRVLPVVGRVGVDLGEATSGTNALAVVAKTGSAITVLGAEHFFDCIRMLSCAAAPIHDQRGQLAGVLDLTVESRAFGFDAAALVGVYATAIENRLLQSVAQEQLVLQFQACPTLLRSPLAALAGVGSDGRIAWTNGSARQLLGLSRAGVAALDAEALFGTPLAELLSVTLNPAARAVRLPNGLTVWLRAQLQADDGAHRLTPVALAPAAPVVAPMPAPTPAPAAATESPATLGQHTRSVIEASLAEHQGNISRTARSLGVSRGLLYRRLRDWAGECR
ncbi:MAG: helix-turn-helix domain-containing protein [Rubrivivax sp.]|nr:helix-turn-helix domain-containing protein [Rubrivivax sp.]